LKPGRQLLARRLLWLLGALAPWWAAAAGPPALLVPEGEPYQSIGPLLDRIHRSAPVQSVAFSPDGRSLASGSDKTVVLWDLATGRVSARLEGHDGRVRSVAFSPDGGTLASGSDDRTVRLWNLVAGRERLRLEGHSGEVLSVAFSPDGGTLASGSSDKTLRLWDLAGGRERTRLAGHSEGVQSVAFSPDGGTLASGSDDKTLRLWDVAAGRERSRLAGHGYGVLSVAYSPDGLTLASGSWDMPRLWDVASGRERARLKGHGNAVLSVAFSPDGRTLASGSIDKTVRLWETASGRERGRLEGHGDSVPSVAFSPDGHTLASGSWDDTLRLWDVAAGRERSRLAGHGRSVCAVAFSPDGRLLASGSWDAVRLWDVASGQERGRLEGHGGAVCSVAFSPDGRSLARGSDDKTVRLWDVGSGNERTQLGGLGVVRSVAFSPDGSTLAIVSDDRLVRRWDVASGRVQLEGLSGSAGAIAYSPDGRRLASGALENVVLLWDVTSGLGVARLKGHGAPVSSVAFSPDGRTLASGSDDRTVRLWEVASGRELARFAGHGGKVGSVAFSPDGRTLASGSDDRTVRLWDVAGGRELARFAGHGDAVRTVAFSPDGRTLASGSSDNTMRLWEVAGPGARSDRMPAEKAIILLGDRGTWATCLPKEARCFRRDDGTLIAGLEASGRPAPLLPPGGARPLTAELLQDSQRPASRDPAKSPPSPEPMVPDVLSLSIAVRNPGPGRAFWVRVVPAPGEPPADWALEPTAALPILEGDNQPVTLAARIHLLARSADPGGSETTIKLAIAQAHGDPIPLDPVVVKVLPFGLKVEKAERSWDQKTIAVTLQNAGRAATGPLAFRLTVPGLARQPAELTREKIEAGEKITLSFGLDPGEDLPPDLVAALSALTLKGAGDWGLPVYDWDVPVPSSLPLVAIVTGSVLLVALMVATHYQRTYRHPAVVRLTANPAAVLEVELADLPETARALEQASRLDSVLLTAGVDPRWLAMATSLAGEAGSEQRLGILARRLGQKIQRTPAGPPSFVLPAEFPVNLLALRLRAVDRSEVPRDVFNELGRASEVTLALGATAAQRKELSKLARRQPGMLVAPDGAELTRLMLAEDPTDELARLIARYVPVPQLSPYQTGGGVNRPNLFFGRSGQLAQIMGRDPANYLIVGGRRVGKSSLLKEVQRRFEGHPQTECRYVALSSDNGFTSLAQELGLPEQAETADLLEEFRSHGRRHILFLLDEADIFIHHERERGYETLQALRALSEEGRAHFILAGFWSLYQQAVQDYQSPLKNFGSVLTIGALEREACRALAFEPMEHLGVGWESVDLVEKLIDRTGQRANLISIACHQALHALGPGQRTITAANLNAVLEGSAIRNELIDWGNLGETERDSRIDRIVVYASIARESFSLADLLSSIEQAGFAADPEVVKSSLARLELAFVLARHGNEYTYQVPLQRDLIRADAPEQLLKTEIRAAKAG
jgi:WD40 repeat protein